MWPSRTAFFLPGLLIGCLVPALQGRADDDAPIRALLVCGGCCHDYKQQKDILTKGISERANVEWTIAYDPDTGTKHLNPVYQKADWYKGFDVIVHDECSADVKDLDVINNTILKPHKDGLPGVVLHCGMHCYRSEGWPKVVTPWFEFTGLQTTGHGAQQPIAITYIDKQSEITKGLEDWTTIQEELYNNIAGKVLDTAHALARGKQGRSDNVVVWTNLYNHKAKVFATTIGHNNDTVADKRYLDLVTRGLLWSVGKLDAAHLKPAKKVFMDGAEPKTEKSAFGPDKNGMVPAELAHGKLASASSHQGEEHLPGAAVDGDSQSRWCAADSTAPQSWQVDLGSPHDVIGCRITWEHEAAYQYKIEGSGDGNSWKLLSHQTHSQATDQVREHEFKDCCGGTPPGKGVRFVRLTVTGLPEGSWASLFEFELFGSQKVKATPAAAAAATPEHRKVLAGLKAPPGFNLTVFAAPPDVSYCTGVTAAPTGEVFIAVDQDGSLGRKPGMGRIVRAIDSKGTGVADHFNVFAQMEHPRGMVWDDGKLYVLHPPYLTVYYDDNRTGVANRHEDLVTGISNERMVNTRGADHTTNQIRMGIDGWIYIATGDFGCVKAVGKDDTQLQFHGGGILRVRPDGSGLEVYSRGHRNIYDVAIDPLMNVFTRDNTNDGDNWNDRLAYIVPTGIYGYPSLFMHFPGEFIDCLADYGGGSPCGSLFLDEPGLPGGLFTVEWGNSQIDHHPLTAAGANFKAGFEKFMDLPRGTDLDVDGQGNLYASSWANGGFDYSGPNVGYVIRLAPRGHHAAPFPDLRKDSDEHLLTHLTSASHVCRQATQREILRRGNRPGFDDGLRKLVQSNQPLASRVAALFTYELLRGKEAAPALAEFAKDPMLREFALRALCDRKNDTSVDAKPFIEALTDSNPRVRLVAAWGLGRLAHAEAARALLPLTADSDFLVAHVATNALVTLNAIDVCLSGIGSSADPKLTLGALHVLKQIHDTKVVDGLVAALPRLSDPGLRSQAYASLCRLCYREADWDGQWWGTRPDTSGPYYQNAEWDQTQHVKDVLRSALGTEKPQIVRDLLVELEKHKIALPELPDLIAKAAASDPAFQGLLVDMLSGMNKPLSADQVAALRAVADNDRADSNLRAKAIRGLVRNGGNTAALDAAVDVLANGKSSDGLDAVSDEFVRDPQFARRIPYFVRLTESSPPQKRELAYSVLMNLSQSRLVRPADKERAAKAVEKGWADASNLVPMLRAVGRVHADEFKDKVSSLLNDPKAEVAQAAAAAAEKLGLKRPSTTGQLIESMKYEQVVAAVRDAKGDAARGKDLFQRVGCVACHTTSTKEPPKGPMLGGIGQRYSRAELCESILKPSAKIAQGFETQWFKTIDNDVIEGFVVHEGGDQIEVRQSTGVSTILKKSDIKARGKRDTSIMPEGLAAKLTPHDLASLIAFLESQKA